MDELMYCVTPLIESLPMSKIAEVPVFLKLENTQPTSSFKQRGMSNRCKQVFLQGHRDVISSSGGNAGMALAYSARKLGMKCTIVLMTSSSEAIRNKLMEQGAEVVIAEGECWSDIDIVAKRMADETGKFYVNPFDHPDIWAGNSTIIKEIAGEVKSKPSVVITCVGGGGLLCGLVEGMQHVGWSDVPVICMETEGAASFHASFKAGRLVKIPKITSIAVTLGATCVCARVMECIQIQPAFSELVSDRDAVSSCLKFANDHRILVEPACGAALSAIYSGILSRLRNEGKIKGEGPAIVIVCGGNGVDINSLLQWKKQFSIRDV